MTNETASPAPPHAVVFGEVLFDVFPDGSRSLGGAPFNVARHLAGFGTNPRFVSRIGEDDAGREILRRMAGWAMETEGVQRDPEHATGEVRVTLDDGTPSYEIVENRAWDHIDGAAANAVVDAVVPDVMVAGSLVARSEPSRAALFGVLERWSGPLFLDVNLRPPWTDRVPVDALLARATWAKLNEDELAALSAERRGGAALLDAAAAFRDRHRLGAVVITRGAAGAAIVSGSGASEAPAAPIGDVVDTVGAGDAFSAVALIGLVRGWDATALLRRAARFAGAICGQRGAVPEGSELYARTMKEWQDG